MSASNNIPKLKEMLSQLLGVSTSNKEFNMNKMIEEKYNYPNGRVIVSIIKNIEEINKKISNNLAENSHELLLDIINVNLEIFKLNKSEKKYKYIQLIKSNKNDKMFSIKPINNILTENEKIDYNLIYTHDDDLGSMFVITGADILAYDLPIKMDNCFSKTIKIINNGLQLLKTINTKDKTDITEIISKVETVLPNTEKMECANGRLRCALDTLNEAEKTLPVDDRKKEIELTEAAKINNVKVDVINNIAEDKLEVNKPIFEDITNSIVERLENTENDNVYGNLYERFNNVKSELNNKTFITGQRGGNFSDNNTSDTLTNNKSYLDDLKKLERDSNADNHKKHKKHKKHDYNYDDSSDDDMSDTSSSDDSDSLESDSSSSDELDSSSDEDQILCKKNAKNKTSSGETKPVIPDSDSEHPDDNKKEKFVNTRNKTKPNKRSLSRSNSNNSIYSESDKLHDKYSDLSYTSSIG